MYKVKFEARLDQKFVEKFKKEIKNSVINNGLDKVLQQDLEKYKKELLWSINSQNPSVKEADKQILMEEGLEKTVILPKADEDILKTLTGVDLTKIRTTKDYTTAVESKVALVNDGRVRLRLPLSPYETFEENYQRAKDYFNSAIYVGSQGAGNTRYLYNTGFDLSYDVKVVCSTDTGDTPDARKVFESYQTSNRRPRQERSEIGRFAEWTLKQSGVARIFQDNNGFVDLTEVVNKIKQGNIEEATLILQNKNLGTKGQEIFNKLEDIKSQSNLNPEMEAYTKIIKLVSSMTLEKLIKDNKTQYSIQVDETEGETSEKYNSLYNYILKDVGMWVGYSSPDWIKHLEDLITKIIKTHESSTNPTKV